MSTVISKQVYEFLREKLLAGQYLPGTRISEFAIAKELRISRSPIREAISKLISDGLIEKHPGIGVFVKVPDLREIKEVFVLREMLECHAVEEVINKIKLEQINKLQSYCNEIHSAANKLRSKDGPKDDLLKTVIDADLAFHMLILKVADNQQILKIIENYRILTSIFSLYFDKQFDLREVANIWREHTKILQAIKKQDSQKACYWIKKQIHRSQHLAIAGYEHLTSTHKPVWVK